MKPARDAILWAAQNRWLSGHLPRFRFVRASVRRFMPGGRLGDVVAAAGGLEAAGIPSTFTYLGEHVRTPADADDVAEHYQELLDRIEERRIDAEVSAKPSHLGLALGPNDTFERLRGLAERSATRGRHLFVDMEDSSTVEPTLELYRRLLEATPNVGVCLQAYLHRTPTDVEDVAQGGGSIRLVKGAYREPRELALQRRVDIGRAFVDQAIAFLEVGGGGRLALGTHDLGLIEEIERRAGAPRLRRRPGEPAQGPRPGLPPPRPAPRPPSTRDPWVASRGRGHGTTTAARRATSGGTASALLPTSGSPPRGSDASAHLLGSRAPIVRRR